MSSTLEAKPWDVEWVDPLSAWSKMTKAWKILPGIKDEKIVPPYELQYKAFELVKPEDVKVVILGQDPYPTKGHANGLAFSVCPHVHPLPPTLENILREYSTDLGYPKPRSGDLSAWASKGVLLLNTALTTVEGKRGSHLDEWKDFTYETVRWLSGVPGRRVWLLWGSKAQAYEEVIYKGEKDKSFNAVIKTTHPSPLSAYKPSKNTPAFIGSRCFSLATDFLGEKKEFWKL